MKPVYKYILAALGALLIVGVYLLWGKFTSPIPSDGTQPTPLPISSSTPQQNTGQNSTSTSQNNSGADFHNTNNQSLINLTELSDTKALDYWILKDTGEVYYITPSGVIWTAKKGADIKISDNTMSAINEVFVAPGGKKILVSFGDPNNPQWGIFDVIDKVWRPLPNDIKNAAWGIDDSQLLVVTKNGQKTPLSFANIQKTPPEYKMIVSDFELNDVWLKFEAPQNIYITEKASFLYPSHVWRLDTKTLTFDLIIPAENGLWVNWDRENKNGFMFSPKNNDLFLSTTELSNSRVAPFITFPEKCDTNTQNKLVYCFVPENIAWENTTSISFPDDYFKKKFYTVDNILTLDTNTHELGIVFNSSLSSIKEVDAVNPEINNNTVYFLNRYDEKVYSLELPPIPAEENATSTPSM